MTHYQFKLMEKDDQANTLWEHGVHLTELEDEGYKFILYQIEGFYVEVWYHKECNQIRKFRSFASTDQLEPYLSKIKIKI
jgi:hypothetical protein